ncbi:LacI family DNA-binding transcriptional regulator [Paenibacillus thalictri]|uniref:LacI family transcriptional regulator n=1 Tax=Paenibacillus thalictri TaxID=2527873 RepID=A0A4Q9DLC9_9BACL|nr:LacI family DNA-binding transcriptional regulator [Paenibacillus thalictri]TBL74535.1 LacI family transcriptional regulator [Paenibacillus thalictri]
MKMEDIARLAGVSKSAVSIALSGKPGIGAETREKIMQIAKEAGYVPRPTAKPGQVQGHTLRFVACTNSGIVLEQYDKQPFFMELIHDIEESSRARGYSLLFSSISTNDFEAALEDLEEGHEASGLILLGTNLTAPQIRHVAGRQPYLVVLDTCYETLPVHFIVMNNMMGAYQAARHLLDLGHRRVGYVQSHTRMYNFDSRKKGFITALKEESISLDGELLFEASPTVVSAQQELKERFAALGDRMPTALFCECDYIAISVIKTLAELGFRVPDDVSVVGFDNIREATIVSPELTTVHVEKTKIAELAVATLIDMIEDGDSIKRKSIIDTKLVVRSSSRAVKL